MSDFFKLDIKSYNENELEDLLNLKQPYTLESIIENHSFLENKLLADESVDKRKKNEIKTFLLSVKDLLTNKMKRSFSDIQTSALIQQNQTILNSVGHNITESSRGYKDLTINMMPKNEEGVIQKQILTKVLCISSEFRDNYYKTKSSDFTFNLPTVVKNVIQMELVSLEMPLSFYQISRELNNDYFWIKLNKKNKWYYISIPQGNYTTENIQNVLNEIINNTITVTTHNSNTKWVEISEINGKTKFKIADPDTDGTFSLYFNRERDGNTISTDNGGSNNNNETGVDNEPPIINDNNSPLITRLGWILGYRLGEYLNLKESIGEGLYNDWPVKHLYFVVDDFNKYSNNFIGAAYTKSLGNINVLSRITTMNPASSGSGPSLSIDTQFDEAFSLKKREYFGPVNIQKLHIQILDPYGRIINLNNMDFSFSINLASLYD